MFQNPKILIADDDAGVREAVVAVVRHTIPTAIITAVENGRQALDDYRRYGADLVISNFIMPEMSGPSFVKSLRDLNDPVPVIMVSGSPEAEALGMEAGIDRFVHKHDLMAALPTEIKSLLDANGDSCRDPVLNG
jgi:DNA-binding NarL/FixJ family response regulator